MATQQDNFRVRYGLDVGNKINAATPTTAYASINLPHGNAPTTPTNGDMWTTTVGTFVRVNGTTIQMPSDALVMHLAGTETITGSKTFTSDVTLYPADIFVQSSATTPYGLMETNTGTVRLKQNDDGTVISEFTMSGGYTTLTTYYDFAIFSTAGIVDINALTRFDASTTTVASIRIPHGVAPTTPVNGDVWTTTAGMYARINGATVGPFGAGGAAAWGSITGTLSSQTDLQSALDLKVALAGTQTITGAKTFTTNPAITSTSGIPSLDITSIQAAGYAPAFLNLARQGVASGPTPDSQGLGEIRFSGLTTTSAYFAGASINASGGVNTATGTPTDLVFYTHSGASLLERMRIDSRGAITVFGSTTSGSNNAAVRIQDTSGSGVPLILYNSAGTLAANQIYKFGDGQLTMNFSSNSTKMVINDSASNSVADSLYYYRQPSGGNVSDGGYVYEARFFGRASGTDRAHHKFGVKYALSSQPNATDSAASTTGGAISEWGGYHPDWGNVVQYMKLLSEGDFSFNAPGLDGYNQNYNSQRAHVTIYGADSTWSTGTVTASIATDQLTVTSVAGMGGASLRVGQRISSNTIGLIPPGVYITAFGTGTGATGTYTLSTAVGTVASTTINVVKRAQHLPVLRLWNSGDSGAGSLNGVIEFWNESTAGDGKGTRSFIASEQQAAGSSADIIFGTSSSTKNAIEQFRINPTYVEVGPYTTGTVSPGHIFYINQGDYWQYSNAGTYHNLESYNTDGARKRIYSSNSGTHGTKTAQSLGSVIEDREIYGVNSGGTFSMAARHMVIADAAPTSSYVPGKFVWSTTDSADGSNWHRMKLNRTGQLSLGSDVDISELAAYRSRLSLVGDDATTSFTGSITTTVLTVTAISGTPLVVGSMISGPNVQPGTRIISFGTGTGGTGDYNLNISQTRTSTTLYATGATIDTAMMQFRSTTTIASNYQHLGGIEWYSADVTAPGIKAGIYAITNEATNSNAYLAFTASSTALGTRKGLEVFANGIYVYGAVNTDYSAVSSNIGYTNGSSQTSEMLINSNTAKLITSGTVHSSFVNVQENLITLQNSSSAAYTTIYHSNTGASYYFMKDMFLVDLVPIVADASTTGYPSIRLPHGVAPSAPTNGDMWTTTSGVYARINGITQGPLLHPTLVNRDVTSEFVQTGTPGPRFEFRKAEGTTTTRTAALSGANLGILGFKAYDGASYVDGGYIQTRLTSNATAGFAASKMEFFLDNGSGGDFYLILNPSTNAMTTTLAMVTPASTTTRPSLRMPHGSAPSAPTNGDVWTTTAGMYAQINGSTVGPFGVAGGGGMTNPMTTLGDIIYGGAAGAATRLAGDTSNANRFLRSVSSGGVAAAPTWAALAVADVSGAAPLASPAFTGQVTNGLGAVGAPSISFTGDTNTGIWSPGAETIAFSTAGVKRAEFNSLGELTMTNATDTYKSYMYGGNVDLESASAALPTVSFFYGGGATVSAPSAVASGNTMGEMGFWGHDGTTYVKSARILTNVTGTVATSTVPSTIWIENTNAAGSLLNRFQIDPDGTVFFKPGGGTTTGYAFIDTDGSINQRGTASGNLGVTRYSSSSGPSINLRRSLSNTINTSTGVVSGSTLGSVNFLGYDASSLYALGASISSQAQETWSATANGSKLIFSTTPLTTASTTSKMEIGPAGEITGTRTVGGATAFLGTHFYGLSAVRNLTNGTGAQSIFGVGLTVAGSTTYEVEMEIAISNAGTTTNIKSFTLSGGTATFTSVGYSLQWVHTATSVATSGTFNQAWLAVATATALGATSTTNYTRIRIKGLVRVNASGTFIPQISYGAAPGNTPIVQANSYVKMTPIGSNTVTTIGTWA